MKNLQTSELRYRRLFEAAQDGILILDAKTGMIEDVNPFLINMLGYSREELVEKRLWEVGAFQDVEASQKAFEDLQEKEYIRYEDLPLRTKSGQLIQVEFVSNVYLVKDEKVIQCNIRDITERSKAHEALLTMQALLREQSIRDHLTGLFNRRYMEETLERELLRAVRQKLPLGLLMIDVDDFKKYNDTLGHAAGDEILQSLAKLLIEHTRGEDIVCRYGGDEFIVVMPGASREATYRRANLISASVPHCQISTEKKILKGITISIGIATFSESGNSSAELLREADATLYQAKHQGRGQVVLPPANII
jgi:diguanylate cyclase (GGDEF)-like protein/PAS domain S-box-containing protein